MTTTEHESSHSFLHFSEISLSLQTLYYLSCGNVSLFKWTFHFMSNITIGVHIVHLYAHCLHSTTNEQSGRSKDNLYQGPLNLDVNLTVLNLFTFEGYAGKGAHCLFYNWRFCHGR